MYGLIKKMFTGFLTGLVNGSNHIKYILLSNQKCMIQPILINSNRNEHSQEFYYYPFTVKLGWCVGSCNTLNDLSNKVCVPNKAEDLNLSAFNMITGTNEPKTLRKHISCKLKCSKWKKKCNSNQWWNNNKCWREYKKILVWEKDCVWNPTTCNCERWKIFNKYYG